MKIGILTFHWATNYGAVLQTYALQEYLKLLGHDVDIINYKPNIYDYTWKKILFSPQKMIRIRKALCLKKKESYLDKFRGKYLNLTTRYLSTEQLQCSHLKYDVLISGSDQILNPTYTLKGEGKPTSAYFCNFCNTAKKIGYAVSFGCEQYPNESKTYAKEWINNFESVGVRECSGVDILMDLQFRGPVAHVPDPTILFGFEMYKKINIVKPKLKDYVCVYMLRSSVTINRSNVVYIDDVNSPLTLESWIGMIANANVLITNSYHGMIMAILCHVPFVAILEQQHGKGMNDRFYSLLNILQLKNRICKNIDDIESIASKEINWNSVDEKLVLFRKKGIDYLEKNGL